jgi:hypothetical protein
LGAGHHLAPAKVQGVTHERHAVHGVSAESDFYVR